MKVVNSPEIAKLNGYMEAMSYCLNGCNYVVTNWLSRCRKNYQTTLFNRILTYEHGKNVAVIVNEFGEVGINNQLVIDEDKTAEVSSAA